MTDRSQSAPDSLQADLIYEADHGFYVTKRSAELMRLAAQRLAQVSDTATPEIVALCDISRSVLHVDRPYIFRKMHQCAACAKYDITSRLNVSSPKGAEDA